MRWLPLIATVGLGLRLAVIDLRSHRLPNRDVAVMSGVLAVTAVVSGGFSLLATGAQIGVQTFGVYAVVYLVSRGQFGMGDVKFGFPLGMAVGCYAPSQWLDAVLGAFAAAALISLILVAAGRLRLSSRLAFGPYMVLATVAVCLTARPILP
jgi:leader peptidase (prepilin peptidase)/N-methyltransferase